MKNTMSSIVIIYSLAITEISTGFRIGNLIAGGEARKVAYI